ncbi:protodermal factor 1 [Cicer arietinum]|uniref:Protodermal factor 1 n=1 Tax=Cicer arietinum TaxID=3827 RepID=A0A1S2Z2B2_CICAR|nr:protodermal factor 1 [Cicer arietinum]
MERKISYVSFSMFALLVGLLSQNLVVSVMSTTVEDQKNFYTTDPHSGNPSAGFTDSLCPHRSSPPSSHGSSSPPSHGNGGGYYNPTPSTPPSRNCGSSPSPPPHDPSTPSTPSHNPTPSNPPSRGGYYNSPPSSGSPPTLTPPSDPSTPIDPGTPTIPSPPFFPSSSPFTGTCNYWRSHPGIIWGILGWWGTTGNAFGITNSVPGFSPGLTLPQALSNTRTDGLGELYREGTASFLNSLVNHKFPYTTDQVRERFASSLHSNKAAATQAHLFKMANEGKMKPRT